MDPVIIQISWFIRYVPQWFGPALIALGIGIFGISYQHNLGHSKVNDIILMSLGTIAAVVFFLKYQEVVVVALLIAGSWIRGIGQVRFYQKLMYFFRSDSYLGNMRARIAIYGLIFFVLVTSGWLILIIMLVTNKTDNLIYRIGIVLTITSASISFIGYFWRFRPVTNFDDDFVQTSSGLPLVGVLLSLSGSEVFNMQSLFYDVAFSAVGIMISTIGFWIAMAFWFLYESGYVN